MHDFLGFPDASVVVVTGAGSGIGAATAALAAAAGLAVSVWDRDVAAAREIVDRIVSSGRQAQAVGLDVTDEGAVRTAFAACEARLGPVGLLVNNAGPANTDDLTFHEGIADTLGCAGTVLAAWLETDGAENGAVVNVASVCGTMSGGGASAWYPAGKAGIAGYTRWLAVHRPRGIRANAVAPGATSTPRTKTVLEGPEGRRLLASNPMRCFAQPADVAASVLFLLSPAAGHINGVVLPVDGGLSLAW